MRRSVLVVALVALLTVVTVLVLGGCSSDVAVTPAPQTERVRISGSGTCLPLLRILTEAYDAQRVDFVYLPGLHSGGGIQGVANSDLEIGSVSRELTEEEAQLGLVYTKLSDDGLAIAVHPSVTIDGLTSQQVRDIYAGKYSNWAELGGPDLPLVILDRNEDESAKIILRQYVLGEGLTIAPGVINLFYEPDMIEGLEKTPGAIGYFSLGFGLSEDKAVRYLKLDGIEPSVENIENGSYKVVRPLGVVARQPLAENVRAFIEWATSDEAIALARERGFAPPITADAGG